MSLDVGLVKLVFNGVSCFKRLLSSISLERSAGTDLRLFVFMVPFGVCSQGLANVSVWSCCPDLTAGYVVGLDRVILRVYVCLVFLLTLYREVYFVKKSQQFFGRLGTLLPVVCMFCH